MALTVEQRDKMICDLYVKGTKINDIISLVGVSQNTMYNVLHRNEIRLRTLTNADKLKKEISVICSMADRNESVKNICEYTNLNHEVVIGVLKKFREEYYKEYLLKIKALRKKKDARANSLDIKRALEGKKSNINKPKENYEKDVEETGEKISSPDLELSMAEKLKKELEDIDSAIREKNLKKDKVDIEEIVEKVIEEKPLKETSPEIKISEIDVYANATIVSNELARGKTLAQIIEEYGFKPGDYEVGKDENRDRPKYFRDAKPMVFQHN